jgi:hypothetical protein
VSALDSWKEVAAYLERSLRTVQRWEKQEGLPVHRHTHDKLGSVYASPAELDSWWKERILSARILLTIARTRPQPFERFATTRLMATGKVSRAAISPDGSLQYPGSTLIWQP